MEWLSKASSYRGETSRIKMSKIDKYIKRYRLKIIEIKMFNLESAYVQYRQLMKAEDRKIKYSPHAELANLYYNNGQEWLENNFKQMGIDIFFELKPVLIQIN